MPAPKSRRVAPGGRAARTSKSLGATEQPAEVRLKRRPRTASATTAVASLAEQVTNGVLKPLGLVVLTTERIQEVLDDAAERGRVTRSDANELAAQLISRGRQQTDQLLSDVERVIGFGRQPVQPGDRGARWSESIDLLVRSADRARRTVGAGQTFPILGYDDLTAAQVQARLEGLAPAELRKVREYERRHANRKVRARGDRQVACSPLATTRARRFASPRRRHARSTTATSAPSTSCSGSCASSDGLAATALASLEVTHDRVRRGRAHDGPGRRGRDRRAAVHRSGRRSDRARRAGGVRARRRARRHRAHPARADARPRGCRGRASCCSSTPTPAAIRRRAAAPS